MIFARLELKKHYCQTENIWINWRKAKLNSLSHGEVENEHIALKVVKRFTTFINGYVERCILNHKIK